MPAEIKNFKISPAWLGMLGMALVYSLIFVINLILPLKLTQVSYTMRLWDWVRVVLIAAAAFVWLRKWKLARLRVVIIGLVLAVLCGLINIFQGQQPLIGLLGSVSVFICFVAGDLLFQDVDKNRKINAFSSSILVSGKSLLTGVLLALPLAALNNFYFYQNAGGFEMQNVFISAFEALRPGIAEEVVYRYFILALCFSFIGQKEPSRWQMIFAVILAVVPHSLNHLPDLFLQNPLMGLVMLMLTSLLFGLPMALLQVKRDLETAIAFHWMIDFLRFLFGF